MKLTKKRQLIAGSWVGLSWIAMICAVAGMAQGVSTATVQGTVYEANGQPGSGTLSLSWPAFTTSNGLAVAAVWEFNITDGTSCGIKQFSNNSLVGESSTGGAVRMILAPYDSTTNMDSLYCTDPNPSGSGGGNYVRARGFAAFASYGGTGTGSFANGAVHVQHMFDESSFSYIMAGGTPLAPYGWQIDDTCCGDSFDHVQGLMRIGKEDLVIGAATRAGSATVNYTGTTAKSLSALVGKTVLSFDNQNPATGANAANQTIASETTVTAATATTLTLSRAAVNTTNGNILEIDPGSSGGSSRGGATMTTFADITANDPAPGMPNVLIGGGSTDCHDDRRDGGGAGLSDRVCRVERSVWAGVSLPAPVARIKAASPLRARAMGSTAIAAVALENGVRMQNAKDSFYATLRARLSAINPERRFLLRGPFGRGSQWKRRKRRSANCRTISLCCAGSGWGLMWICHQRWLPRSAR